MLNKRLSLFAIGSLVVLLRVFAGGGSEDGLRESGGLLKVVASTNILGDVVSNLGGDLIELSTLIGPGQDPHSFEPTPSTYASIENAQVIFVNGFELEESLLEDIEATARVSIVPVSDGIKPMYAKDNGSKTSIDPHVWLDPANVFIWIDNIEKHLVMADPSNREVYRIQADAYRRRLENLDKWIRERIASIHVEKRKLVTDHHIFGYFAKAYGFEVIGTILPGASTSADASARSIGNLVELLDGEGVSALFVGTTAGRSLAQLAETIASELNREIRVIGTLTGSLSASGEPGDTYISYMEYNTRQIVKGLSD